MNLSAVNYLFQREYNISLKFRKIKENLQVTLYFSEGQSSREEYDWIS